MKKVFNKKMLLSIISGVLVTAVIIGAGTFAWFTSRDTAANGDFTTAIVKITSTGDEDYKAYNFHTYHDNTRYFQSQLEYMVAGNNPAGLFTYLKGLYNATYANYVPTTPADYDELKRRQAEAEAAFAAYEKALIDFEAAMRPDYPALANYFASLIQINDIWNIATSDQYLLTVIPMHIGVIIGNDALLAQFNQDVIVPYNAYKAAIVVLEEVLAKLANAVVYYETDPLLVTPGSFMTGNYAFENESNIPVYFRLEDKSDINSNVTVLADISDSTIALTKVGGYWYCLTPVPADIDMIEIGVIAYIPGSVAGDPAMGQKINFGGAEVEIIQATNNAVSFYDAAWATVLGHN